LFYVTFLWAIIVWNFMRALVAFDQNRLATEGVITVNGLIVTFMIIYFARKPEPVGIQERASYSPMIKRWALAGLVGFIVCSGVYLGVIRSVYGDKPDGWSNRPNLRLGPNADWRVRPIMKNAIHR